MARCLNLTRSGEYAIAALARLTLESDGALAVPVQTLAERQRIPKSFLTKILSQCSRSGIVRSKKGPAGGLTLGKPPGQISLLEIIEACEGSYRREFCVFYHDRRCVGPSCEVYCPLREEEEALRNRLAKTNLASMAEALKVHPDAKAALKRI